MFAVFWNCQVCTAVLGTQTPTMTFDDSVALTDGCVAHRYVVSLVDDVMNCETQEKKIDHKKKNLISGQVMQLYFLYLLRSPYYTKD